MADDAVDDELLQELAHRRRGARGRPAARGGAALLQRQVRRRRRHPHDPPRRRRHRVARLGRDAAAHVPALVRAPRLQGRDQRLAGRRRGRPQERHAHGRGRERLRAASGGAGRASPRAHEPLRLGQPPPHELRVRRRFAAGERRRRGRDQRRRPAHRHLSLQRRRRAARQQDELRDPHHAPAHQHRGAVPERALAAAEQDGRHAHAQVQAGRARRAPPGRGAAPASAAKCVNVNFGSQIRSYVLHPYQMVKDLRTGHEVGNAQSVLDGDLDGFVHAYLVWRAGGSEPRK